MLGPAIGHLNRILSAKSQRALGIAPTTAGASAELVWIGDEKDRRPRDTLAAHDSHLYANQAHQDTSLNAGPNKAIWIARNQTCKKQRRASKCE